MITDDIKFGKEVELSIQDALKVLPRKKIASESWYNNGAIIIVDDLNDSIDLINQIAPEHLELSIQNPNSFLKKIIASAARQPFFVAPKDNTSIPDFHVISAGVVSKETNALANLAPSI